MACEQRPRQKLDHNVSLVDCQDTGPLHLAASATIGHVATVWSALEISMIPNMRGILGMLPTQLLGEEKFLKSTISF